MVIVCPECSTKFRVNPERIPDGGAKVRCARCKHIFIAEKPAPEIEPTPIITEPAPPIEEPTVAGEEAPPFTEEPGIDQPDEEPAFPEQVEEPFAAGEDSFSYEKFREMDREESEDEDFSFGEETEDEPFAAAEDSEEAEEDSFSFSGPDGETSAAEEEPETEIPTDKIRIASGEVITKKEAYARIFSDDDAEDIDEKTVAPVATQPEETDEASAEEVSVPAERAAKSSPSSSILRILLLLILGLLIIGGALYYINGPEQIEQAIQQLLGQTIPQEQTGNIALTNLEGKFINNDEAGELFVIRGEALNNYKEPRAAIQVKGVIFDQNGNPLVQKTIFCGNPINDQELQTLPFSKLEERMRNQFGKSLNNMKVNSKQTIPFVIAFRDLPKNLAEFSVDITSSEPVAQ